MGQYASIKNHPTAGSQRREKTVNGPIQKAITLPKLFFSNDNNGAGQQPPKEAEEEIE